MRLGHADARHHVARYRWGQKIAPHLVRSKAGERGGGHVGMRADPHPHPSGIDAPQCLVRDRGIAIVEPQPTEGNRLGNAQQPQIAERLEHPVRGKNPGLLPFIDERIDMLGDRSERGLTQRLMLSCQLHENTPSLAKPGTLEAAHSPGRSQKPACTKTEHPPKTAHPEPVEDCPERLQGSRRGLLLAPSNQRDVSKQAGVSPVLSVPTRAAKMWCKFRQRSPHKDRA